jgi:hypothetical protein
MQIKQNENQLFLEIGKILPNFLASPTEEIKTTKTKRPWISKDSLENIFLK